jgi:transmembrane sensor
MPHNEYIANLIIKHLQETISEEEAQTLDQWVAADENNRQQFNRLTNSDSLHEELIAYGESDRRIKEQVYAQLPEVQDALIGIPKRHWMRYVSIAAVIVALGFISMWYWWPEKTATKNVPAQQTPVAANIPAGGNKATLTLADGTVIDLDKAANGTIAKEGKTVVSKREDGQLEYQGAHSPLTTHYSPAYNLLSTPRGGQYQLLLPDGSKVWLNAASSIRYPTAFVGNERRVEVTGETYFEVTKDPNKPFKVIILPPSGGIEGGAGEVEVLGTHFNINAYGDETAIVTTLLEGKIRISAISESGSQSAGTNIKNRQPVSGNRQLLLPGEEAQINSKTGIVIRKNVDTEAAVAWMKGFFDFHNANIKTVMMQVSRWYNVEIQYMNAIPAQTFEGSLDRNIPLNELIDLLQKMGPAKFRIEGRTIKVQ